MPSIANPCLITRPQPADGHLASALRALRAWLHRTPSPIDALLRLDERQWQDVGVEPAMIARMQALRAMETYGAPGTLLWRQSLHRSRGD